MTTEQEVLTQIIKIVFDFYAKPDKNAQALYERALVSDEAWRHCPILLVNEFFEDSSRNVCIQFFGASVLFSRISRMYSRITAEERQSIRILLLRLVGQLGGGQKNGEPSNVFTRVCVALVHLALHMMCDRSWPEPLVDIFNLYMLNSDKLEGVHFVDDDQRQRLLLKLFHIFPQELKAFKDVEKMELLEKKIGNSSILVTSVIDQIIKTTPKMPKPNQKMIVNSIASWSTLNVDIELFTSSILKFMVDALVLKDGEEDTAELNECACEALIEFLSSMTGARYKRIWTETVFGFVIWTKQHFCKYVAEFVEGGRTDEDTMDYLCRIVRVFVTLIENHIRCFLTLVESTIKSLSEILCFLTICSSVVGQFPKDERISEITFSSWYVIYEELCDMNIGAERDSTPALYQLIFPFTLDFVRALIHKVSYIDDPEKLASLTTDDRESFRIYRVNVSDTLVFLYTAHPRPLMSLFISALKAGIRQKRWTLQEATVFMFGTIVEQENVDDDQLVEFIGLFLSDVNIEADHRMTDTAITLIGQLCGVLPLIPQFVEPLVELCLKYLEDQRFCQSSTISLRTLARETRSCFLSQNEEVVRRCMRIVHSGDRYRLQDRFRAIGIVGFCLSFIDPPQLLSKYLETIIAPYINMIASHAPNFDELSNDNKSLIGHNLALLSHFVAAYTSPISEHEAISSEITGEKLTKFRQQHLFSVKLLATVICPTLTQVYMSCPISLAETCADMFNRILGHLRLGFIQFLPHVLYAVKAPRQQPKIGRLTVGLARSCMIELMFPLMASPQKEQLESVLRLCSEIFHEVLVKSMMRLDEYRNGCNLAECVRKGIVERQSFTERYAIGRDGSLDYREDVLDFLEEFVVLVESVLRQQPAMLLAIETQSLNWILNLLLEAMQLNEMFAVRRAAELFTQFIQLNEFQHIIGPASANVVRVIIGTLLCSSASNVIDDLIKPLCAIARRYPPVKFSQWLIHAMKTLKDEGRLGSLNDIEMNRFVKLLSANMTKKVSNPDTKSKIARTIANTASLVHGGTSSSR